MARQIALRIASMAAALSTSLLASGCAVQNIRPGVASPGQVDRNVKVSQTSGAGQQDRSPRNY